MPEPSAAPTLARRLAAYGPVSLFQRIRNLLLRPARHELADARREIQALRHELDDSRDRAADLRHALEALRADQAAVREELEAERRQRQAQHIQLQAVRRAIVGGDESGDAELDAQGARWPLQRRIALLEGLLATLPPAPAPDASRATLVSVVLPTRDRAACLAEAIDSVRAQSYPHWELLVVDDDSSDGTAELVARYRDDARIRYRKVARSGPSGARNHALRDARGELVAYLDSDNAWYPGFLAAAVAAFEADPALEVAYGALASESHAPGGMRLLLEDFDRGRLERGNYIDLNTVVHRRALVERLGGFDESLARLVDWELLLRYTAARPARPLPVLAARYGVRDRQRITDTVPAGPSWLAIRSRLDPLPVPARRPRVLYVVWHYPQLSETYIEGEIRCLQRWGVDIAVWREVLPASPYEPIVPLYEGDLAQAVRDFQPDLVHVHWLGFALARETLIGELGVPVSVRLHGFDTTAEQLGKLLANDWLHRVYAFPRQLRLIEPPDERMRALPSAFDTSYFQPAAEKDPRLVLRSGSCLQSKDIGLFFELAKRLPTHRFVFAGVTCNEFEHYPEELRRMAAEMESPVELRFDLPREEMAGLLGRAGIYVHTICPPQARFGAPIGMPISIAEAMATGAYVLVRKLPELLDYVGEVGAGYADIDEAEALIRQTMSWSEPEWRERRVRASDHGFVNHADEWVLRQLYTDWCALLERGATPAPEAADAA